jgi:hypothetical protein
MKRFLLFFCVLVLVGSARADVVYSIRYFGSGVLVPSLPETRVFVSENAVLTQRWKYGYASLYQEDTLSIPAQKKQFVMNRNLNILKVEPIADKWGIPNNWNVPKNLESVRVIDIGQEAVLGFKTRHFRLERLGIEKKVLARNDI